MKDDQISTLFALARSNYDSEATWTAAQELGEFNIAKLYKKPPEKNYFENKFYVFDGGKRYKGEWNLEGEPHGFGVLFYTDGSKYEGEF